MKKKIIVKMSELPEKQFYNLSQFIRFFSIALIIIFGMLSLMTVGKDSLTLIFLLLIMTMIHMVGIFFWKIVFQSLYYILHEKTDLDKFEELTNYFSKNGKIVNIANISDRAIIKYYQGSFEESIGELITKIELIMRSKKERTNYKFLSFCTLYKSGIMTGNEKLIEKKSLRVRKTSFQECKERKMACERISFLRYDV